VTLLEDHGYSDLLTVYNCIIEGMGAGSAPRFRYQKLGEPEDSQISARGEKNYGKNGAKFQLDTLSTNISDIVGILDDDACLLGPVRPLDIFTENGTIIVRGTKGREFDEYEQWVENIGLPWTGHFMTDFPVIWWKDMLPDIRSWMVKSAFGIEHDGSIDDQWSAAYAELFARAGHPSEYNVILNFAAQSNKWNSKYAFQIRRQAVPSSPIRALAMHQHRMGCPGEAALERLRHDGVPWYKILQNYPQDLCYGYDQNGDNFTWSSWGFCKGLTDASMHPLNNALIEVASQFTNNISGWKSCWLAGEEQSL
jgi:hypothetical protein